VVRLAVENVRLVLTYDCPAQGLHRPLAQVAQYLSGVQDTNQYVKSTVPIGGTGVNECVSCSFGRPSLEDTNLNDGQAKERVETNHTCDLSTFNQAN
jgi:hypothetical protein